MLVIHKLHCTFGGGGNIIILIRVTENQKCVLGYPLEDNCSGVGQERTFTNPYPETRNGGTLAGVSEGVPRKFVFSCIVQEADPHAVHIYVQSLITIETWRSHCDNYKFYSRRR